MIDELLADAGERMEGSVAHAQGEFSTVRTGRANPGILHRVHVDYYGSPTPLQQLATISVPEPRMLVVQPYDVGSLSEIEKAISNASLGLSPSNDGKIIRLVFPPLTEERRRELIRVVRNMAEDGRVSVRSVRRQTRDDLELLGESEDEVRRAEKQLQDVHDKYIERIDELLENKEHELLEV
ncbi:MAG TPA: ribosome recycling factor [Actinobacteria bacterium]|nr:ribosome recycling factor [Actinomycetota bacterium]